MSGNIKDILAADPVVYDFVHNIVVERWNKMNIPFASPCLYSCSKRLLSRYRDDYESFKNWDVYDKDANIEEAITTIEKDDVLLSDSEEDAFQVVTNVTTPTTAASVSDFPSGYSSTPSTVASSTASVQVQALRGKQKLNNDMNEHERKGKSNECSLLNLPLPRSRSRSYPRSRFMLLSPGLKVLSPYSSEDARGLLKVAIRDPDPCMVNLFLFLHEVLDPNFVLPIGKAKSGKERMSPLPLTQRWSGYALKAAEILAKDELSADVINLRSIRPLDRATINDASIVEESFEYLDAPVERIAGADIPMPYAANLERMAVPQIEDIVHAARRACYRSVPLATAA
ncbi:hypothetical protein Dimus_006113 [Dionaea muscipula]